MRRRDRAGLQGPVKGRAGVSEPQVGGPEGPAAPPPAGRPGASARAALRAGLLRRVAHAASPGTAALRRPRPGRRRATAPLRGRRRAPLAGGTGQGRKRRLQPAAWMSTRLRTFSWPRTHTRRRPPVSYSCAKGRFTNSPRRLCRRRPRAPRIRRRFPYNAFCAARFSGGVSPVFLSCQQRRPRSGSDT